MLSGFRIAASIGIILLVSAEMIGANRGIGAFVLMAGNLMAIDQLMAGVVVLSLMGLTVAGLIGLDGAPPAGMAVNGAGRLAGTSGIAVATQDISSNDHLSSALISAMVATTG